MSLLPILSLLICISVHACNGRYLNHVFGRETVVYAEVITNDKDEVVSNPSISSENIATQKSIEIESQGLKVVKKDFSSHGILLGASSKEQMASLYDREERTTGTTSGTKAVVPRYSPDDMQRASEMKEPKFRVRSMLVFKRSDVEEATESKENETAEDLVETDYAQPHRKPPIHNERS
ncbi:hypothetical protein K2173_023988 [Erythroxylum novogranatense]|uniref:Uncharacterized protein n=1 Tax=Erythroxylum novogranatense TaxID=1862640 RepID=A0AAV8TTA3_9ROSI|nr:hypothetical protein K2173_023988 [Erythroxylum novogranatense]